MGEHHSRTTILESSVLDVGYTVLTLALATAAALLVRGLERR